jgi:hypothetical protein
MQTMRRSFKHRPGHAVSENNVPTESTENGNCSNNNENNEIGLTKEGTQRKKRGRTQPKRPQPGQQIPIKPLGEE